MGYLSAKDEAAVRTEFERVGGPVKLTVFASELGGEHNGQTVALIKEVAALSDQLSVVVLNPHIERDQAAAYGLSESPAVVVEGALENMEPICCQRASDRFRFVYWLTSP